MALAETMTVAAMMAMLATMDIVNVIDDDGNEIPADAKTTGQFIEYVEDTYFASFGLRKRQNFCCLIH